MQRKDTSIYFKNKLIYLCVFAGFVFLFFKYAVGMLLPFLAAYAFSMIIEPVIVKCAEKARLPKKLCAVALVTVVIAFLFFIMACGVYRLFREATELLSSSENTFVELSSLLEAVRQPLEGLYGRLGGEDFYSFEKAISAFENKIFESLSSFVAKAVSSIISKTPAILVGISIGVVSCYYFSMDGTVICDKIKKALPQKYRGNVMRIASIGGIAFKKYVKAYVLIGVITFFELAIGLSVLRIRYSFLIALGIALIDIVPILGSGTVIIPWAVVMLMSENSSLGFGLLILYGVITILRQIIEPHIVGNTIGIHPVLTLFSMYAGLRLFGIGGMILAPSVAFIILESAKEEG